MTEIRLPQYGMGMTDGTIIKWHVAVGDTVVAGQPLCDVEAAKTNVELESPVGGTVTAIFVTLDQNVPVNTPLLTIDANAAAATDGRPAPVAKEADVVPVVDTAAAPTGDGIKATPLAKRAAAQAGVDLVTVHGSGPNGRIRREDVAACASAQRERTAVQIEPRARKVARDLGVDLGAVTGSGPAGRIVAEDVLGHSTAMTAPAPSPESAPTPAPAPAGPAEVKADFVEIKHSVMRRTIARRLTESKQTVPHFYLKASCRIDALLAARKAINTEGQEKVSVNDLVIRAVAMALVEVPEANVTWDEKAMRQYHHVDIAVAVASPRGLVTPVVRHVETKTIRQIAAEVRELAGRGREGKLKPEEYQGGSTSVSNLGMFGIEEFSAIINPPQSTIFAVGTGEERCIVIDGKPAIATMITVTVSVDHRAIDGAVGAQLLSAFKAIIENPVRILA